MVIPPQTRIDGLVETSGDLRVEGSCHGKLDVGDTLIVARGATCRASVRARSVRVLGEVIGNIVCSESIAVAAGARVVGDLRAPDIAVDAAGEVDGKVDLLPPAPKATPIRRVALETRGPSLRRPPAPPPPGSAAPATGEARGREPAASEPEPRAIPSPPRPTAGRTRVRTRSRR